MVTGDHRMTHEKSLQPIVEFKNLYFLLPSIPRVVQLLFRTLYVLVRFACHVPFLVHSARVIGSSFLSRSIFYRHLIGDSVMYDQLYRSTPLRFFGVLLHNIKLYSESCLHSVEATPGRPVRFSGDRQPPVSPDNDTHEALYFHRPFRR